MAALACVSAIVAPSAVAAEATDEIPAALEAGDRGTVAPGLLLQGWWVGALDEGSIENTFRVRRAEISLKGEMVPDRVGYGVMIDPSKLLEAVEVEVPVVDADGEVVGTAVVEQPGDRLAVLQDLYVTLQTDWVEVSIGQFKVPVSYEGVNSSSKLLLAERALVSKAYGDRRDIGLRASKTFERFGYVAGIWNGAGQNRLDGDNDKDLALRLEAYPVDGLTLAAVGYATVGARDTANDRLEGDVRLERGPLLVQAELIRAVVTRGEAVTTAQGWYGALGVTVGDWQPVVRVGQLDPDVAAGDDTTLAVEGGLNWFVQGRQVKEQLSVSHFAHADGTSEQVLILASQIAF